MAVSTDSAKIKFWVGDFNQDTTLTLPAQTLSNKLALEFDELVSSQLTNWGDVPLDIYVLYKVTFNSVVIYENDDFESPSTVAPPSNPDITIVPDANPATTETITVNNYPSIETNTAGTPSSGNYSVQAKFVYWAADTAYGNETTTFTADFTWEEKEPVLTQWYDTTSPRLDITDNQSYIIGGVTADRDIEFNLKPPLDNAEIISIFDNVQKATYTAPWVGGNEVVYTVLLTYDFTDHEIINAQQKYDSFTIYFIDNCVIYNCLKDQYDVWKAATCGSKSAVIAKDTLFEATAIALQITQGLGCNSDELSQLIDDFNELLDCDCGCVDETPRQLGSTSLVPEVERQSIIVDSATTQIDLSEGSTIEIDVQQSTFLSLVNIEQYTDYRIVLTPSSGGEVISFSPAGFEDDNGIIGNTTLESGGSLIMDFYTYSPTILTLVSRSDADDGVVDSVVGTAQEIDVDSADLKAPVLSLATEVTDSLELADSSLQPVEDLSEGYMPYESRSFTVVGATSSIDLSNGNIVNITADLNTEFQISNAVVNKRYIFVIETSSVGITVTFDNASFLDNNGSVADANLSNISGVRTVLEFIGTSTSTLVLMNRNDA